MAMTDATLDANERLASQDLRLARQHARTLERLAVLSLILAVLTLVVLGVADGLLDGICFAVGSVVVWAVLRAVALSLHLAVDRLLLADAEDA